VNAENRFKAFEEGVHWRSVSLHEEVVVFEPLWKVVVVDHGPTSCPDSPGKLLGF